MKKITTIILIIMSLLLIACKNETYINNDNNNYVVLNSKDNDVNKIINYLIRESGDEDRLTYSFSDWLDLMKQDDSYTLYLNKIGNIKYYISIYCDSKIYDIYSFSDRRLYELYTWVKYTNINDIQDFIGELKLICSFCISDYIVEKDIINDVIVNQHYNYYEEVGKKVNEIIKITNNDGYHLMLGGKNRTYNNDSNCFNLGEIIKFGESFLAIKDEKDTYIVFNSELILTASNESQDIAKRELDIYYDYLYPYFLNDSTLTIKRDTYEIHRIKINVKNIISIMKGDER